jgi:hypothetical protein
MQSITTDKRGKKIDNKQEKPIEVEPTDKPIFSTNDEPADENCDESNVQTGNNFFQAVGIISGKLTFERGFKIELEGKKYNVKFKNENLLHFVELGMVGRFAVYPKINHFPTNENAPTISFEVLAIESDRDRNSGLFEKLQDNEFFLRGLWQFIPVCLNPVVSVLQHNYDDKSLAKIACLDTAAKCKNLKAQYFPLIWEPPVVPPFHYQTDAQTQDEKYFIEVKAKLDIKREEFMVDSLIATPTTELPKKVELLQAIKGEKPAESKTTKNPKAQTQKSNTPVPPPQKSKPPVSEPI